MKHPFFLCAATVLMLMSCGGKPSEKTAGADSAAQAQPTHAPMKTFQTDNFSLQVPAGWEEKPGGADHDVMLANTAADKYSYNLTLKRIAPLVNGGDAAQAPGLVEKMFEGLVTPADSVLAANARPVGRFQARRIQMVKRYAQNGQTLEVVQTYLMLMDMEKNVGYQIVTSALPEQQAETDPVFEQIIQSLEAK